MARVDLSVTGMTCDHCRSSVEAAAKSVSGVYGVYVDLDEGFAEIDFDSARASTEDIITAIKTAGYGAEPRA